jgi:hypothetical protein
VVDPQRQPRHQEIWTCFGGDCDSGAAVRIHRASLLVANATLRPNRGNAFHYPGGERTGRDRDVGNYPRRPEAVEFGCRNRMGERAREPSVSLE